MTPIVLVPGLLCTAEVFAPQIAGLWPYGPITVASTLRGTSIPEIAATIISSAPPRFALAGISMGGHISLEILRQVPERVTKLALLSSSARADTAEQAAQRRAMIQHARAGNFPALIQQLTQAILHPLHQDDATLRDVIARMAHTVGIDGFVQQQAALLTRADRRAELASINVPTVILVGDGDALTPPKCSEELAAGIPGAHLVTLQQCGHGSTLEQPATVNRALVDWLRD